MDESVKKRVDESWKEQIEREKQSPAPPSAAKGTAPPDGGRGAAPAAPASGQPAPAQPAPDAAEHAAGEEMSQARFDLFVSGLAMEAFIALGDIPHPATRKQAANLPQAKYLIDLLGILEEKTRGNATAEEQKLLGDALYQLRMRYLTKSGGA